MLTQEDLYHSCKNTAHAKGISQEKRYDCNLLGHSRHSIEVFYLLYLRKYFLLPILDRKIFHLGITHCIKAPPLFKNKVDIRSATLVQITL